MGSLNTVVLLAGLVLTALGGWLVAEEHLYLGTGCFTLHYGDIASLSTSTLVLLGSGLAVILLAAIGCCGALATSRCLLATFSLLLVTLAFGQISVAGLVFFKQLDYGHLVKHMAKEIVQEKYHANNTATVLYWDHVQTGLSCCGAEGPEDWEHSHYTLLMEGEVREIGIGAGQESHHFSIPPSCCRVPGNPNCTEPVTRKDAVTQSSG